MSILNIVEGFESAAKSTGESLYEGEQFTYLGQVVDETGTAVDITGHSIVAACEPHRATVIEGTDDVRVSGLEPEASMATRRFASGAADGVMRIHDGPAGQYLFTIVKDLWPDPVLPNLTHDVPDMVVVITLTSDDAPFPDIEIGRMHLIYRKGES